MTNWFSGPSFLKKDVGATPTQSDSFELVEPDTDADVRPLVATFATELLRRCLVHIDLHTFLAGKG